MRVALCQINTTVGALRKNRERILDAYARAVGAGAQLVAVPELALSGYPPRDLLELHDFLSALAEERDRLTAATGSAGLLFGSPLPNPDPTGKPLMNGVVLAAGGTEVARVFKKLLPVYDVFDEARHFQPHPAPATPVEFGGLRWGIHICEDAWNEDGFWPRRLYPRDPVAELAEHGADVFLNLSASPFHARKSGLRRSMFESHVRRHGIPYLYTNLVGANDELVFDGETFAYDGTGTLVASGHPFDEEMILVDVTPGTPAGLGPVTSMRPGPSAGPEAARAHAHLPEIESIRRALVLGVRDYAAKCGFRTAVLGLSGGIDSAVTAVVAAQALGVENVWGVALPGPYSSEGSVTDARELAGALGIRFDVLPIQDIYAGALEVLDPAFAGTAFGVAEENLQARARGMTLMALSNKFGHLLLTTGNKSEIAVGYCTLYGDMAGGLAVISDVPKTTVYALARHLNGEGTVIPVSTIDKPPSAELRPDQTDQDSLPPYEVLDRILEGYIEEGLGEKELTGPDAPRDLVRRTIRMVWGAEYKRRQAAPGIRISPKAFGLGRRMPIAVGWPDAFLDSKES